MQRTVNIVSVQDASAMAAQAVSATPSEAVPARAVALLPADNVTDCRPDVDDLLAEFDTLGKALPRENEAAAVLRIVPMAAPVVPAVAPQPAQGQVSAFQSPARGVAQVNADHFIAPLAGEMTVWKEGTDNETGRRTTTPISTESLRLAFAPYTVDVATPTGTKRMWPGRVGLRGARDRGSQSRRALISR